MKKRLGITATDAEKVAYVLGNESVDVGAEVRGIRGHDAENEQAEDQIVGKKIKKNVEQDGKIKKAVAEAATGIESEKTGDLLDGSPKEHDKGRVANKKTEGREGNTDAATGKEAHLKDEVTRGTKKRATKRKAEDAKPLTEGIRRSTRRKL